MTHILLIEDDDVLRTFLADNLTADGFEMLVAGTVAEGKRLLETHAHDEVFGGYLEHFTRDWSPPAMALSTHTPPAARNAWATCLTAFDSPPEVHQWMTSAFGAAALAGALPRTILSAPAAAHNHAQAAARLRDLTILSPFSAMFFWHVGNVTIGFARL